MELKMTAADFARGMGIEVTEIDLSDLDLNFHWTNGEPFCARCGLRANVVGNGAEAVCPECDSK
jgi:NADH pyrophosphatase NudC (nudix superfamily)